MYILEGITVTDGRKVPTWIGPFETRAEALRWADDHRGDFRYAEPRRVYTPREWTKGAISIFGWKEQ